MVSYSQLAAPDPGESRRVEQHDRSDPGRPVRHFNTSKQRLWLGTYRYCGCRRDTATNPGSDSSTTDNSYSVRPDDANTYSYGEFTSPDSHAYIHSYSYCNASTITDAYRDRYHPANANTYSNRTAQDYAKTSANSASATGRAVTLVPLIDDR